MTFIGSVKSLDLESFVNGIAADSGQGALESNRAASIRVKSRSEKIQEKREEKIQNLLGQMKGASGGGCLKIFCGLIKVFDLLLKPLSLVTGGQLKLELGKALDALQEAKKQKTLFGLRIDGDQISKALEGLKKLLQDDFQRMESGEAAKAKDQERIMEILEELQRGLQTAQKF